MPKLNHSNTERMALPEKAAVASGYAITGGAVVHAADAYVGMDIPGVDQIPLLDHSTSMLGGYLVGLAVDGTMDRVAARVEHRKPAAAEKIRKLGAVAAFASSLASQVFIESHAQFGYGDKLDVAFGVAATLPAVVHSRAMTRQARHRQERQRLTASIWE